MIFETKLKGLVNQEIAVVMVDGNCYKGILTEFDSDLVVLREVEETTNDEICWQEPGSEQATGPACDERRGYLVWNKVALPEVLIRVKGILRIWPWKPLTAQKATASPAEKKEEEQMYLYHGIRFG